MGYGYSLDLRERVITAWQKGNLKLPELAELFGVSIPTIKRWTRRYRETGSVSPLPHGGGHPRVLSEPQIELVERMVLEHPDWTEEEYTAHVVDNHGFVVSRSTVGREIRRLGYSVKKRPSPRQKEIVLMSDDEEQSTSEMSPTSPLRVWYLWTKRAPTSQ